MYLIYRFESFSHNFEVMMSQYGTIIFRFQENSFLNEYFTSNFLLLFIYISLSPIVHEIRVWVIFRANIGFMTSLRWAKTSKFRENVLINEYFTSNILLLLIFIFVSIYVHEIPIGIFLTLFLVDDVTTGSQKFWNSDFKNENLTSSFPLLLAFIFLSLLVHKMQVWTLFDPILGWWRHPASQNISVLRNWSPKQTPYFTFYQILISIFLSLLTHDIQLWALFTQFGDNDVTKRYSRVLKN